MLWRRGALLVLAAMGAAPVHGAMLGEIDYQPVFMAERGLELRVQNYTKLPLSVNALNVFLGGDARLPACQVSLPAVTLPPGSRDAVLVASAATVRDCFGPTVELPRAAALPMVTMVRHPRLASRPVPLVRIVTQVGREREQSASFRLETFALPPRPR